MRTTRRHFLAGAGSFTIASTSVIPADAAIGPNDKFDLVIKGGDVLDPSQNLRAKTRHRHPLWPGRGDRTRYSSNASATGARRCREAGDARAGRPSHPCLSVRLGDRHPGRRIGGPSVHDHLRVSGRCRRQQLRRIPPLRRGADAHPALCLRAHREHRPGRVPDCRALQHRLCADRCRGARRSPRTPTW